MGGTRTTFPHHQHPSDCGTHPVVESVGWGVMEGFPSLCAILPGRKGWFSGQCCTVDMVAVDMLCLGCVARTVLSTRAGQGQGNPHGVWMVGFYVWDVPAIPQNIPTLPAQQVSGTLGCFRTQEVLTAGLRPTGPGEVCMGWNGEKIVCGCLLP